MHEFHLIMPDDDSASLRIKGNPERIAVGLLNCMLEDRRALAIISATYESMDADEQYPEKG